MNLRIHHRFTEIKESTDALLDFHGIFIKGFYSIVLPYFFDYKTESFPYKTIPKI